MKVSPENKLSVPSFTRSMVISALVPRVSAAVTTLLAPVPVVSAGPLPWATVAFKIALLLSVRLVSVSDWLTAPAPPWTVALPLTVTAPDTLPVPASVPLTATVPVPVALPVVLPARRVAPASMVIGPVIMFPAAFVKPTMPAPVIRTGAATPPANSRICPAKFTAPPAAAVSCSAVAVLTRLMPRKPA